MNFFVFQGALSAFKVVICRLCRGTGVPDDLQNYTVCISKLNGINFALEISKSINFCNALYFTSFYN